MDQTAYSFSNVFAHTNENFDTTQRSLESNHTINLLFKDSCQQQFPSKNTHSFRQQFQDLDNINDKMAGLITQLNQFNRKSSRDYQTSIKKYKQNRIVNKDQSSVMNLKERIKTSQNQFMKITQKSTSKRQPTKNRRRKTEIQTEGDCVFSAKIKSITKKIQNYQTKVNSALQSKFPAKQSKKVDKTCQMMFYPPQVSIKQRIAAKMRLPKTAQKLLKQINHDETLRKYKKQFSKIYDDRKWTLLAYKLHQNDIQIPYQQIEQIFTAKIEESDPFYSVTVQSEDEMNQIVKNLIKAYKQSEQNWHENLQNKLSLHQFDELKANEHFKGQKIKLDDLTVFINSITKSTYKCRDITLLFNRFKTKSTDITIQSIKKKLLNYI